jgi:hypothetical protein
MTRLTLRNLSFAGACAALLLAPTSAAWADNHAAAVKALQEMSEISDITGELVRKASRQSGSAACYTLADAKSYYSGFDAKVYTIEHYSIDDPEERDLMNRALRSHVEQRDAIYAAYKRGC